MLQVLTGANNFAWSTGNTTSTRPGAGFGTSVSISNNNKALLGYTQVLSALARDAYGVLLNVNSIAIASSASDTIIDVGVDPAGGSSYSVLLPDLLVSCADAYTTGGVWFYFPIWIKSGSTIGVRGSQNGADSSVRVNITVFGSPKDRRLVRCGTKVTTYGVTTATSTGTAITPGTTSDGTWTSLGTTTAKHWWWQVGFGCNNSVMSSSIYHLDLSFGDGTNNVMLMENRPVHMTVNESVNAGLAIGLCNRDVPSGSALYGRMQCNTTPPANISMAAHGVSG